MALFKSFFLGGFECSTHHRHTDLQRLDITAAVRHDQLAAADYRLLAQHNIRAVRDGLRWHLIGQGAGRYDWSSFLPMLRAARQTSTQVIWDLCHYGWPNDLDIWSSAFVRRFAQFARDVAYVIREETDEVPFYTPINEISFWSWAGGDVAYFNPFERGRGFELKVQLARAAIEAIEAIWSIDRRARIVHADPVINIIADPTRPADLPDAQGHHQAQYQGWDLLSGALWPQIGGDPRYLDILGVNYYHNNQWIHNGPTIDIGHRLYRPFRAILHEVYARYERPIFIAETGIEFERRPNWLAYIGAESRAAMLTGVPLEGICWYPILNHPGWDNDRHCLNGLLDYHETAPTRTVYAPLAAELQAQQRAFSALVMPPALEMTV